MTRYNLIALIAIIAMPAAAAGNFGLAAYEAMTGRAPAWFAVLIGLATAVGLEATGVLLGHTATGYWQRKDLARFAVSALGMALYVGFGTWEMSAIPFGRVVPALAALAYFAAAMQSDLHTAVVGDATKSDLRTAFDLEQARLDRETTRLLRVERERAKFVHQDKPDMSAMSTGHQPDTKPDTPAPLTDRQLTILDMLGQQRTQADIAAAVGVTERTIRRDIAVMNGQAKEMTQ